MSTAKIVRNRVMRFKRGEPFTTKAFLKLGPRQTVDKALSRLVERGVVERIRRGVFVRPERSRFGVVMPDATRIVEVIARNRGETIQIHGAEAVRRFELSTQVPMQPVFYTSGQSREFKLGKLTVKLKHVSQRKLQHAGKRPGVALTALWYLGKKGVNAEVISAIRKGLTSEEFETLMQTDMPVWMSDAFDKWAAKGRGRFGAP